MSCTRCVQRLPARLLPSLRQSTRTFTTTSARPSNPAAEQNQAKPRQGEHGDGPPSAVSTGAAQPFSTPLTPAPVKAAVAPPNPPRVPSHARPGTVLKGLNYLKNKQDPLALEDHEYPDWLWTMLDAKAGAGEAGEDVGDLYSKSKKARRVAAKRAARLAALEGDVEEKIPIHHQTIDLPFAVKEGAVESHVVAAVGPLARGRGSASVVTIGEGGLLSEVTPDMAEAARLEVKKEKRRQNRAGIKERNYLGGL